MSSDSKFYIYSKDGCGFCDRLVSFLDDRKIVYEKFNLDEDYSKTEFLDKFGHQSTFPQVIHQNQKIGGMKDTVRYIMDNKYV
jgi:glutaredoxin